MPNLVKVVTLLTTLVVFMFSARPSVAQPPVPILKQLLASGWTPNAPLQEQVQPLPTVQSAGHRIKCFQVRFTSHVWHGQPVRIFGFYAAPADAPGKVPALLLVHGGGGYGTLGRVVEAAGHGFAALSIDLPGKGTNREKFSRSTGPDMTVPQIFAVTPTVSDSYLYHAVLAEMRAVTFLCRRPEVDAQKIGLVGASWGGATGLLTTSLDPRVRCFVDIYGSGFVRGGSCWGRYFTQLPPGQMDVWEANYDASRYLAGIHVPILGITGTNDACYWLPQFQQTMRALRPAPRLLCLPNQNHRIDAPARAAYFCWLGSQLLPGAVPLPAPLPALRVGDNAGGYAVSLHPAGPNVRAVTVSYVAASGDGGLTRSHWTTVACALRPDGRWAVTVPAALGATYLYATASYADGFRESVPVHTAVQRWNGHTRFALVRPTMCAASLMTYDVCPADPLPAPPILAALSVAGAALLWLLRRGKPRRKRIARTLPAGIPALHR